MVQCLSTWADFALLQYDFDASVGWWVARTYLAYNRALNDELAPHGVTFRQTQVLGWIAMDGELTQVELAGRMQIEPPTLVGILDRMERDGWIIRAACPKDRRKKMIQVGPRAEPVWEKIIACGRQVRARATAGLSEDELTELRRLLDRVRDNVMQSPSPSDVGSSLGAADEVNSERTETFKT
jgi:MarR family transcriptional regulator for hemolysin